MPVEFSQYLDVAARYNATHSEAEASSKKIGLIGGRVVAVANNRNNGTIDVETARRDFVDSLVAEFGEEMRPVAEQALGTGMNAKPLTSRMIMQLNDIGREKTKSTVAGRLRDIVLNAAKRSVGTLPKDELDSLARRYATTPELKKEFANAEMLRQKAESAFRELGKLTAAQVASVLTGAVPESPAQIDEHYKVFEKIVAAKAFLSSLAKTLAIIYGNSKGAFAGLLPAIALCQNRAAELISVTTDIETRARAEMKNPGANGDAAWKGRTMLEMLPEAIVGRHGTNAALNAMKDSLRPIADRFDKLKADSADGLAHWGEVNAIRDELMQARRALEVAARDGVKYPGSNNVFRPDAALMGALVSLFDGIDRDIAKLEAQYKRLEKMAAVDMFYPKVDKAKLFSGFGKALLGKLVGEDDASAAQECLEMIHTALEALLFSSTILTLNVLQKVVVDVLSKKSGLNKSMKDAVEQLELIMQKLEGEDVDEKEWDKWSEKLGAILKSMTEEERMEIKEAIKEAQEKNILGAMLCLDKEILDSFAFRLADE